MRWLSISVRSVLKSRKETPVSTIEATFVEYTERKDIAILLINQHVRPHPSLTNHSTYDILPQIAEKIRPTVDKYQQAFPTLLEIPSKDHPYGAQPTRCIACMTYPQYLLFTDPSKDSILKRVQKLFGE